MTEVPEFDLGPVPTAEDVEAVTELLGRRPQGQFSVVVRRSDSKPAVLRNAPLMYDGTPMPTLYWLVDPELVREVGVIESAGGVNEAEADIDEAELAEVHARYAKERETLVPKDWQGPLPSGGVGGTRTGVKCLHAHYAYFLSGAQDPVASWLVTRLRRLRNQERRDQERKDQERRMQELTTQKEEG